MRRLICLKRVILDQVSPVALRIHAYLEVALLRGNQLLVKLLRVATDLLDQFSFIATYLFARVEQVKSGDIFIRFFGSCIERWNM